MTRKDGLQLGAFVAITLAFVAVLILYQHRGSQISHVEGRVTKIERGNPCLEEGPNSKLCQKSRNLFARTITFTQACEIVKKANPAFNCTRPAFTEGGGQQNSPQTGSQLPGGHPSPPRASLVVIAGTERRSQGRRAPSAPQAHPGQ